MALLTHEENSAAGKRGFKAKKEVHARSRAHDTRNLPEEEEWNSAAIGTRTAELVKPVVAT